MGLFNFQTSALRKMLFLFWEGQTEDTVHILGFDLVRIDTGDVKASGVGAVGTLHADHFILLVLFLHLGFALCTDGQRVLAFCLYYKPSRGIMCDETVSF